jgi:hypothetical protein
LRNDGPDIGLSTDDDRDDRQVERDENILDDRDTEDDRNILSSFVTMALEDVAVIPAMMSASRAPQPTQNPNAMPMPKLMIRRVPPESRRPLALLKNSS